MTTKTIIFLVLLLVVVLVSELVNSELVDVSVTGQQTEMPTPSSSPTQARSTDRPPLRQVSNLEHFSAVITKNFIANEVKSSFLTPFTDEHTSFIGFPFSYHASVTEHDSGVKMTYNYTGSKLVEAFGRAAGRYYDMNMHCTGQVFKSGPYEGCEAMWLFVQAGHWVRLQVHGINLLKMAKFLPHVHTSPKIELWSSYFNQDMLTMQALNEVTSTDYRREDNNAVHSDVSIAGTVASILRNFISSHEIIPINYYTINYLTQAEREVKRKQYQPQYFVPILFNATGRGDFSGFFIDDVEFAFPISTSVVGRKQAEEQYTEFMKNVERAFVYLEGPIHVQSADPSQPDVIRASTALTYVLYIKNNYPNERVICRGLAFMEVDKRKSSKQFSSFKYLFNEDSVLTELGNKSNVRIISQSNSR